MAELASIHRPNLREGTLGASCSAAVPDEVPEFLPGFKGLKDTRWLTAQPFPRFSHLQEMHELLKMNFPMHG